MYATKSFRWFRQSSIQKCTFSTTFRQQQYPDADKWNNKDPIEKAHTPPQKWYIDKEIYEKEQDNVLKKYPQYIGNMQQLNKSVGSYVSGTILNEPFITIRLGNNSINSFYNVCRHHASTLTLNKCGNIDCNTGLRCPYHGWTYNINGQLTKATQLQGIKDFKNKDYGLLSIPNYTLLNNLIFLNFGNKLNQTKSNEIFCNITTLIDKYMNESSFDNSNLIYVYSRKYLFNANWKIVNENYLDGGYHVPFVHIGLNNSLKDNTYKTCLEDYMSIQMVDCDRNKDKTVVTDSVDVDFGDRYGDRALFFYIYPNFMINRYGPWMDINYVYPKNENETYVHFDYFIEGSNAINDGEIINNEVGENEFEDDLLNGVFSNNINRFAQNDIDFIKKSLIASDQVQQEDITICDWVRRGLRSSAYNQFRGRYAPEVETPLYHFHQLYHNDMFE